VLSEDVEDQLRPVDHPGLELLLEVALLARAQVLVADQQVVGVRLPERFQLFDLALADEERWVDLRPPLDPCSDDLAAGGAGQVGQLRELLGERLERDPGQLNPDEVGPLGAGFGRDQTFRPFRRSRASSSRLSGAVTESRK
jgi:hypothetical protein